MDGLGGTASVVVLNYNGGLMVLDCLDSVMGQAPPPEEVVCVDNASSDGSVNLIAERFPDVKLLRLDTNCGFAGGMNRGIDATSADFVILLNLDVTLEPDYLSRCAHALAASPQLGGVTGKLLRPGRDGQRIIDTTGHVVYRNRRAVDRGEREADTGQYDDQRELFSICGAAPCYRRRMLDDVRVNDQVFDEDFFAYFEDFDLSWRAQLRGWRFAFVPEAVGYHHRGGSGGKASTNILAYNHRNRLLVMLRNDHPVSFLRHLGGIAYTEVRATLHMLRLRPAALVLAWVEFACLIPRQIAKRRIIQSSRTIHWQALESSMLPYDYSLSAMLSRARQRARIR